VRVATDSIKSSSVFEQGAAADDMRSWLGAVCNEGIYLHTHKLPVGLE
jgi:hypothetical protein